MMIILRLFLALALFAAQPAAAAERIIMVPPLPSSDTIVLNSTLVSGGTNGDVIGIGTGGSAGKVVDTGIASANIVTLAGSQTLTNKTLTSPVINGGTVNGAVIGGSTPAAGSFTTINASGLVTLAVAGGAALQLSPGNNAFIGFLGSSGAQFYNSSDTAVFDIFYGTNGFEIDTGGINGTQVSNITTAGLLNVLGGFSANGTAGLVSKSCLINTANAVTGITLTITGGLITGTSTC